MPNSKTILKFFFALGVWSFLVIGLFRIHGQNVLLSQEHPSAPLSGRLLLQKENRYFEATSTTTDRIDDVLIDNRQGKLLVNLLITLSTRKSFKIRTYQNSSMSIVSFLSSPVVDYIPFEKKTIAGETNDSVLIAKT